MRFSCKINLKVKGKCKRGFV